jgi:hypothetical protein
VARQIEEGVNIGNGDALGSVGNLSNFVTGAYLAFRKHSEVEAGPVVRHQQSGHRRLIHSDAHPITRNAWLRHFEKSAANTVTIPDTHLGIGQTVNRKIFSELAEGEVIAAEVSFPVTIRIRLIYHYGAMLSAMTGEIALTIANYIEVTDRPPALHRLLPDAGVNGLAPPYHIARQTYID